MRDADCSAWLDFSNLPGYAEQRLLRSAASALGLRDPYFLIHEGDAGASTVIDGRRMINFSSYDYLGLNRHPEVRAAAQAAIDRYGVSAGASRLVAGERPVHRALEAALADHYGQDACLTFVSGHAANVSTISALLGPRDLVVHDALAHNSIVMGAQLSAADRRSFPHNDLSALDSMLRSMRARYERALIVAEGLYSMDGDVCDLPALVELKEPPSSLAHDRRRPRTWRPGSAGSGRVRAFRRRSATDRHMDGHAVEDARRLRRLYRRRRGVGRLSEACGGRIRLQRRNAAADRRRRPCRPRDRPPRARKVGAPARAGAPIRLGLSPRRDWIWGPASARRSFP